jgi:hypothetical protein
LANGPAKAGTFSEIPSVARDPYDLPDAKDIDKSRLKK